MFRVARLVFASLWLVCQIGTAQVVLDWPTQNELYFIANPALASTIEKQTLGLAHGRRWNKIKSSPSLSNIFGVLPFENEKMVAALHVFSDKVGPLSGAGLDLAYSYHLRTSKWSEDRLSLGLSLRIMQFRFDQGHLIASDNDPVLGLIPSKGIVPPTFNLGVSYQTEDVSYRTPVQMGFALSARKQLFYRDRFNPTQLDRLAWYGMVGLKILSTEHVTIEPGLFIAYAAAEQRNHSFRIRATHEKYGWITAQFSKEGILLAEVGLHIGEVGLGDSLRVSAGNSWYLGNASTQLGNSVFFGLSYQF